MGITTGTVSANGVEFATLEMGSGPLALCLHGFPDSAHTWRHLMPVLADAGYRVVAPFMRGYAPSSVPADGRFQTGALSADAIALHDTLGGDADAVLVGHDWGAPAVYGAAAFAPERWRRVVGMAVPPGGGLAAAFLTYDQLQRSWYMFFFQHPLSDLVVGMNDLDFIDRLWADWSPGFDATAELALLKPSLRDPANLAAAIGYYRATLGDGYKDPELDAIQAATMAPIPQPCLYLHGAQDGCVGPEVAATAGDALGAEGSAFETIEGGGHFLHLEQPAVVNARIAAFLAR